MLRNKDLFELVCSECGRVFRSDNENARKCRRCEEAARKKAEMRKLREEEKAMMKNFRDKALPGGMDAAHPLRVRVGKIKRYNEEHGTFYTYGQFEMLAQKGFIKV